MKTVQANIILLFVIALFAMACEKEDESPRVIQKEYVLNSVSDPSIHGTVTFTKESETSTLIRIELEGTTAGDAHPAHVHRNAASDGGGIAIGLNDVAGATGVSETVVTQMGDGTPIDYEGLLNFDGHVNVHLSATSMSTLIARGDIGSNSQANNDSNPNDTTNDDY